MPKTLRTSHKKNRPFDFKLIELVRPHPVLYHRLWGGLTTYECMKEKNRIWTEIGEKMDASPDFCLSRWNNLRNHFQRQLRNCTDLCPKEGIIRGSTWPYLDAMRFLESSLRLNRPKCVRLSKRAQRLEKLAEQENEQNSESDCNVENIELISVERLEDPIDIESIEPNLPNETIYFVEQEPEKTSTEESQIEITEIPEDPEQLLEERTNNWLRMDKLLTELTGENKVRAERRILAYLCKCQLRALNGEGVDDLTI